MNQDDKKTLQGDLGESYGLSSLQYKAYDLGFARGKEELALGLKDTEIAKLRADVAGHSALALEAKSVAQAEYEKTVRDNNTRMAEMQDANTALVFEVEKLRADKKAESEWPAKEQRGGFFDAVGQRATDKDRKLRQDRRQRTGHEFDRDGYIHGSRSRGERVPRRHLALNRRKP